MKPLFRWIVGPVNQIGLDILKVSVKTVKSVYGSKFDYLVCYNNINSNKLNFGVELYEQKVTDFPLQADIPIGKQNWRETGSFWKLYPPRMRLDSHEIIMDNDIILRANFREMDIFLNSNILMVTSQWKRWYQSYDRFVPDISFNINTGLVGMPPGFDLEKKIVEFVKEHEISTLCSAHGEDQGLCAAIFSSSPFLAISEDVIKPHWNKLNRVGLAGDHFLRANDGLKTAWNLYKQKKSPATGWSEQVTYFNNDKLKML